MTGWLLRRFAQMIVVIFGVVTLAFLFSNIVPGDPARLVAGPNASPQAVASIGHQLGLDRPLWSQYTHYVSRLAQGDLGTSFALQGRSVASEIRAALPITIQLAVLAVLWELALGLPIGIIAARRPGGVLDRGLNIAALVGLSAPPFWLGLMLLYYLSYKLSVFPLSGVGQLAYHAIATLDVPMITGCVLVAAVFVVLMNFVVDVTYTLVDPRVRLSRR